MHRLLTTLGRGFKERIGWKRLGSAGRPLITTLAITTLGRPPKGVNTGVILVALTDIPLAHVVLAALCVIGAFCTLTFYDFFALRTIGKKHVPYRIAALSSFTSYSIGHNIGATVFTGGQRDGHAAGGDQPADRARLPRRHRGLFHLARDGQESPRTRPERLEGGAALGAADAAANPDRRGRSRILRDGDVSPDAGPARHRFHLAGGGVHSGDPARLRQPCPGLTRRVRRRDAGRAAAIRQGTVAGNAPGVPDPLFPDPVR